MVWMGLVGLAWADCGADAVADGAVARAVADADAAVDALDTGALAAASARLREAIGCQATPITRAEAADIHRVEGIRVFVGGDELAATSWLTAARALDPGRGLGHDIGGPLQAAWDHALPRSLPETVAVPAPKTGEVRIDGVSSDRAPAHLPYVFQWTDADAVRASALVPVGSPLPAYPVPAGARPGRAWAIGAGTSAVLSVAALSGAAALRARFRDPDRAYEEVEPLVAPNRALGGVGVGLGVAAIGLGAAAFVAGSW